MEETKRRRFIIRAVLEGEVDLVDEQGIDYNKDALEDAVYQVGKVYDKTTGELIASANGHYSEKFPVQECSYIFDAVVGMTLFLWDESDNYLGYFDYIVNTQLYLTQGVKVAVSYTNQSYVPTLKPIDKSDTTVHEFTIDLAANSENFTRIGTTKSFEFDATSIINAAGHTGSNVMSILNALNTCDHLAVGGTYTSGYNGNPISHLSLNTFVCNWTYWQNKKLFVFAAEGIDSLDAMKNYVLTNNVKVTFNKGL